MLKLPHKGCMKEFIEGLARDIKTIEGSSFDGDEVRGVFNTTICKYEYSIKNNIFTVEAKELIGNVCFINLDGAEDWLRGKLYFHINW